MKLASLITLILFLALSGCRDAAGPSTEPSPGGSAVIWFNGLSATADGWFPETQTLIPGGWLTGSSPNQIKALSDTRIAVLSSISADLTIFNPDSAGTIEQTVLFPQGSNPYCFSSSGAAGAATLLLKDSVAFFDCSTGEVTGGFGVRANPSGIVLTESYCFVSSGNWPDNTSPGGVSVYPAEGGAEVAWFDTGVNTYWLREQPSGMIHCYATTYADNGTISVIDPLTLSIVSQIHCGGAPGEAAPVGDEFLSGDGWGQGGAIAYTEAGSFRRIDFSFQPTCFALCGDTLYATSFPVNKVYMLDSDNFSVIDSLTSSGEGPQGIIAVEPST